MVIGTSTLAFDSKLSALGLGGAFGFLAFGFVPFAAPLELEAGFALGAAEPGRSARGDDGRAIGLERGVEDICGPIQLLLAWSLACVARELRKIEKLSKKMASPFTNFVTGDGSPPPKSALEVHQELTAQQYAERIFALSRETVAFHSEITHLPEAPLFKGRVSKARQTFEHFDADGSGVIDFSEVEVGLRALGLKVDRGELRKVFDEIDKDGSGELELGEFGALLERVALLRQGRAASGTRAFEQQAAAVQLLHAQSAERPLEVLAEGEVRTLVRCAAADHPAVAQQALDALATLAEAALPCAVAVANDKGLPRVLDALRKPHPNHACRRQGARLLAALTQEAGAANEAAARSKLRTTLYGAALPTLLALGRTAGERETYCSDARRSVAQALGGLAAEPQLSSQLGDIGGGAALKLLVSLANAADAETRLQAVLAIAACAETVSNAWALVGFGALHPLLAASALADPPALAEAALQALHRMRWKEHWQGVHGVDPTVRIPAEFRSDPRVRVPPGGGPAPPRVG